VKSGLFNFLGSMLLLATHSDSAEPNMPRGQEPILLPAWSSPTNGVLAEAIVLGEGETRRAGWGGYSPNERRYFPEFLPALFERTLCIDELPAGRGFDWVFTGSRAGLYLRLSGKALELTTKFYDSPGFNWLTNNPGKFPQLAGPVTRITFATNEPLRAISVRLDHTLTLTVALNGREVYRELWMDGFQHQQLRLTGKTGAAHFRLLQPAPIPLEVSVNPAKRHQTMLGWGGTATPPAYRELSATGRHRWWELVCEYNLLCQREYPIGGVLNRAMDNWDKLTDAKAHYYGDNFPNGEISDFEYNRAIQLLGGFVVFEFWDFPPWIGTNAETYAKAMVNYCQTAQRRTGKPPAIVGLQNEVRMKAELIGPFAVSLRKGLDAAGFHDVKIHLANAGRVDAGIRLLPGYRDNPCVWPLIDYSAVNQYDFQDCFRDPDRFDATLKKWHAHSGDRPFLAIEICLNDKKYQSDGYALALMMGQLYHKDLTLADASLVCYCWMLLNIEQPTFGMTRSLFVNHAAEGFVPRASSHQLRVFGSYSRHVQAGMQRVNANATDTNLLATAFASTNGASTLVLLNRSTSPMSVSVDWSGAQFTQDELTDPYHQNEVLASAGGSQPVTIPPGGIVTRTSVPLKTLPAGFPIP
jgi:hypothetical protein